MYNLLYKYLLERTAINTDSFNRLTQYFTIVKYKKNEQILRPGDICRNNYFVNAGCLRFYTTNKEGYELTRYFAFEGKFGTALTSFIEQKPSFEYIQCLESSELLVISHQDFFNLVNTVPEMNFLYRNILEMAYVTTQRRIYGLQGETALERLRWLMNYQPDIFKRASSRVIATYLGITTYTLSRLKAEL
ncbi:MAG: Crp/Fnr family transcriptional regulator [Chitinophagaceae bacterium]|nr:Crp/Fnr family transcriptional regulator [Chitinophagaceae bacterium]